MRALIWIWLAGWCAAGELQDRLIDQLRGSGETTMTEAEVALIAAGVDSEAELKSALGQYQAMIDRLRLSEKQQKGNGKKKVKAIHKRLDDYLKIQDETSYDLMVLIEKGVYSSLTATYFFVTLAQMEDVSPWDYAVIEKGYDAFFLTGQEFGKYELAAALAMKRAVNLPPGEEQAAADALTLSKWLAPETTYGAKTIGKDLYNKAYELYQNKAFDASVKIALAAAERFPDMLEFHPLCFNLGILMFQTAESGEGLEETIAVGEQLLPHTGKHVEQFEKALNTLRYNLAVRLFDLGDTAGAIRVAEAIGNPHDPVAHHNLLIKSYEKLAEANFEKSMEADNEALLAKLAALDPARASRFRTRLAQMKLKKLSEAGALRDALNLAAKEIGKEFGESNYLSVLTTGVQAMCENDRFQDALAQLEDVPREVAGHEAIEKLRRYVYATWISKYPDTDFQDLIPILRQALADKKLILPEEDKSAYVETYGNALYREIEKLVADRKFKMADEKSRMAVKLVPNHQSLLEQRKLVEAILKRVEN